MQSIFKRSEVLSFLLALSLPLVASAQADVYLPMSEIESLNYARCGQPQCPQEEGANSGATNYQVSQEFMCQLAQSNFPIRNADIESMSKDASFTYVLPSKTVSDVMEITVYSDRFETSGSARIMGKTYKYQSVHKLRVMYGVNAKGETVPDMAADTKIIGYNYSSSGAWGTYLTLQLSNGATLRYKDGEINAWASPYTTQESKVGTDKNSEGSLTTLGGPELRDPHCNTQRRGLIRQIIYKVEEVK